MRGKRGNREKERKWRGRKSLSILSPFPCCQAATGCDSLLYSRLFENWQWQNWFEAKFSRIRRSRMLSLGAFLAFLGCANHALTLLLPPFASGKLAPSQKLPSLPWSIKSIGTCDEDAPQQVFQENAWPVGRGL